MKKIVDCKFLKPAMSSVYSHAVIYYEDGEEKWIKLPKPDYHLKSPSTYWFDENMPLGDKDFNLVFNSTFNGIDKNCEYIKMLDKYEKYQHLEEQK